MGSGQLTGMASGSERNAGTSDDSIKSAKSESTESNASENLPKTTTATMRKGSQKTSKSADCQELKSKAGIVAGALADFQRAGGIVIVNKKEYERSGIVFEAVKLFLVIDGLSIVAVDTPDGVVFDIVAAET